MKLAAVMVSLFAVAVSAGGQQQQSPSKGAAKTSVGLEVGTKIPAFQLRDQNGQKQSDKTLSGKNGTILLFFRSADW